MIVLVLASLSWAAGSLYSTQARLKSSPVIAALLGWAIGGEPLTRRAVLATLLIVAAVGAIIISRPQPKQSKAQQPPELLKKAEPQICTETR